MAKPENTGKPEEKGRGKTAERGTGRQGKGKGQEKGKGKGLDNPNYVPDEPVEDEKSPDA